MKLRPFSCSDVTSSGGYCSACLSQLSRQLFAIVLQYCVSVGGRIAGSWYIYKQHMDSPWQLVHEMTSSTSPQLDNRSIAIQVDTAIGFTLTPSTNRLHWLIRRPGED